ncbi:MAG: hypothetical protein JRG97_00460 [Deltaproteobacteria bacterium]|nr:hypothetical protein [Deltaproteobacteria bacterium]MBW2050779.1 hypothetical protein [Deltaproteobacteria bacterium]MBW2139528.1 hypothetical protein [Deltaproteobacteria bacterium]MBW2321930.1 hypothetical protein [Deltaproteobacteria bacterium]
MPGKYHIEAKLSPNRHRVPGRVSLIDWEEGCLKCTVCVKQKCVYGVYKDRQIDPVSLADTADMLCRHCYQCVQGCPNRLISKSINPEYEMMGDEYWTPAILTQLYNQAETGKIPISGAGYTGPFSGPGFDSMWTDMSEIVRPTRDGIHGREYISTSTDLGAKPSYLSFLSDGSLDMMPASFVEIPAPFILTMPEDRLVSPGLSEALAEAAADLGTLFLNSAENIEEGSGRAKRHLMPRLNKGSLWPDLKAYERFKVVEIDYWPGLERWLNVFRKVNRHTVISVRLPFSPGFTGLLGPLVEAGTGVLHLTADNHGRGLGFESNSQDAPVLIDLIREAHFHLVDLNIRDEVTILISGGIALAEHVAKSIACGADAVALDLALWAALECRVCRDCLVQKACPVEIESSPVNWARQRFVNLAGAWHNQLLEVLGAMGLREVRRLRGEVGRVMFFDRLEEESFGPIFGRRKDGKK